MNYYVTLIVSIHALLTYTTIIYGKPYLFRPYEFDIVHDDRCLIAFSSAIGTFAIWVWSGVF